jgi:2-polyprenyl-3-methyl-5-hydroxy-6-metoxy-1,4-benzoquinol methylase
MSSGHGQQPKWYYSNVRHDIVGLLGTNSASAILEIGCGNGGTGKAILQERKAGRYVAVEINPDVAAVACTNLTTVHIGNIEQLDVSSLEGPFDALILSEVLEHLIDPWATLRKLAACLKPGAQIFASSPNISHWRIIHCLLKGKFQYAEVGIMDKTHLRWFTPDSYSELLSDVGFAVEELRAISRPSWKARLFNGITGGAFKHLLIAQMMIVARKI